MRRYILTFLGSIYINQCNPVLINIFLHLDTVIAPLGTVMAGVRFDLFDGVLSIGLRANSFNFLTGTNFAIKIALTDSV